MDSVRSKEQEKTDWKNFFKHEVKLYRYLHDQACLYSTGHDPEYIEYLTTSLAVLERPPRWVRWVGQLTENSNTYLELSEELEKLYRIAVGENFKRLPDRFPAFYKNVEQINISINDAYESFAVKLNAPLALKQVLLYKNEEHHNQTKREELLQDAMQLNKLGIPAKVKKGFVTTSQGNLMDSLDLQISSEDLFRYADCSKIQCRRYSGKQYRARLRERGKSAGVRIKFGLIIIDKDSEVTVVESIPQAKRPHSLKRTGDLIELPIDTNINLYRS